MTNEHAHIMKQCSDQLLCSSRQAHLNQLPLARPILRGCSLCFFCCSHLQNFARERVRERVVVRMGNRSSEFLCCARCAFVLSRGRFWAWNHSKDCTPCIQTCGFSRNAQTLRVEPRRRHSKWSDATSRPRSQHPPNENGSGPRLTVRSIQTYAKCRPLPKTAATRGQ